MPKMPTAIVFQKPRSLPRLWNAHRPLQPREVAGLTQEEVEERIKKDEWEGILPAEDAGFIKQAMLDETAVFGRKEMIKCLKDPTDYFRFPRNVPVQFRKQVYLPQVDETICLMRTPHLPPKYASFQVPLRWNKFDLKSYLKGVYGVEVLHIRSFVQNARTHRVRQFARGVLSRDQGRLERPRPKKKMTVELIEPFEYPEEIEDMSPWDQKSFWEASKQQVESQKKMGSDAATRENEDQRKSIAEQAQQLLAGQGRWKPTWQSIPTDTRAIQGSARTSL